MNRAQNIVNRLLEDGLSPDSTEHGPASVDSEIEPMDIIRDLASQREKDEEAGIVTKETALAATTFYHRTLTYSDGRTPLQARRNGTTKTWVTRPGEFRVPVKYGMYQYFYIDQNNAPEWSVRPLPQKERPPKVKKARVILPTPEP